jgi:hypothetical protein
MKEQLRKGKEYDNWLTELALCDYVYNLICEFYG